MSAAEETFVGAIDEGTSSTRFLVCTKYNTINVLNNYFFETNELTFLLFDLNIH